MRQYLPICAVVLIATFLYTHNANAQRRAWPLLFTNKPGVNPALTGVSEGRAELAAFAANEGVAPGMGGAGAALRTPGAAVAAHFQPDWEMATTGFGFQFQTWRQGYIRTTAAQFSAAYEAPLGVNARYHHLRGGVQIGLLQRAIEDETLTFEDQFNGTDFSSVSAEQLNKTSEGTADMSVGVLWYYGQRIPGNPEFAPFAGISFHHINRPRFYTLRDEADRMPVSTQILLGGRLYTRSLADFNASLLWQRLSRSNTMTLQLAGRYTWFEAPEARETSLFSTMYGMSLRMPAGALPYTESVAPFAGIGYRSMISLALAYDVFLDPNARITSGGGGWQLALSFCWPMGATADPARAERSPFPVF